MVTSSADQIAAQRVVIIPPRWLIRRGLQNVSHPRTRSNAMAALSTAFVAAAVSH
jgi:hypothetical protein